MNVLAVFAPHLLALVGAVVWCFVFTHLADPGTMPAAGMSLLLYVLLFLIVVGLIPSAYPQVIL